MKIHEYQAKEILRGFGVAVPRGILVHSADEAEAAARELLAHKPVCVVKAQIHAGGRGKGGGVKLARSAAEARAAAEKMLGMQLVTHQTGPARAEGPQALHRGGVRHRARALPRADPRSRLQPQHLHGLLGGRGRDRRGRRAPPGEDPPRSLRSGGRPRRLPGAQSRVRPGSRRPGGQRLRQVRAVHVQGLPRDRRQHRRDQPAGGHQAGRGDRARRQDQLRRQRALPAQGDRGPARRRRGGPARGASEASST